MSTLTRTIDVKAPISYVNKEWTEFMFRQLIGHYQTNLADITEPVAGDEREADSGVVRLAEIDDTLTRITLELEYTPVSWDGADEEEQVVLGRLERDLSQFKLFLEEQCRRDGCG
jgi:hypothetical protein